MTNKTKRHFAQRRVQSFLLETFEGRGLVVATYYHKAIRVAVTDTLKTLICQGGGNRLLEATRKIARKWHDDSGKQWSNGCIEPTQDAGGFADGGFEMKKMPIEIVYQALRKLKVRDRDPEWKQRTKVLRHHSSRVVVITGEIGGRGISYHDMDHQWILTNMFYACDVPDDKQVTTHIESLVQNMGRLNCIYTMANPPPVRFWASQAVHDIHRAGLYVVHHSSRLVEEHRSYAAVRSQPRFATGENRSGDPVFLRATRSILDNRAYRVSTSNPSEKWLTSERFAERAPVVLPPPNASYSAVSYLQDTFKRYIKKTRWGETSKPSSSSSSIITQAGLKIPIEHILDFSKLKDCPSFFDGQNAFWTGKKQDRYSRALSGNISWTGPSFFGTTALWKGDHANMNSGSVYTRQKEVIKWMLENGVLRRHEVAKQQKKRRRKHEEATVSEVEGVIDAGNE